MPNPPRISQAEWEVMNVLWDRSPLPAQRVVALLAGRNGWRAATIKTLLGRLVHKKAVAFDKQGKRYLYRPAVSRRQCVRRESRSFVQRLFGGQAAAMLAHLVHDARLSGREIEELSRILQEKRKG
jgi:BlaI family penicillinase repressor